MEDRHSLTFETDEEGKLSLEEFLGPSGLLPGASFTRAQFRHFVFAQSTSYLEMVDMLARLKVRHELRIDVVSNEARELNSPTCTQLATFGLQNDAGASHEAG